MQLTKSSEQHKKGSKLPETRNVDVLVENRIYRIRLTQPLSLKYHIVSPNYMTQKDFPDMGDPGEDARFSKLGTEKRFRRAGKKHSKKVKIDSRFQGLFTQEKFVSKCAVDKRGRPR